MIELIGNNIAATGLLLTILIVSITEVVVKYIKCKKEEE